MLLYLYRIKINQSTLLPSLIQSNLEDSIMNIFNVLVSSLENPNNETELNLMDYQNKNQFIAAVKKAILDATGETKPEIRFEFEDAEIFEGTNLLSEKHVDEVVFEYLSLEIEDVIGMTLAFATLYPEEKGNVSELRELAEERNFGCHDDINDFAYEFLDKKGFMNNLPVIIENNIDIDAIAEGLMMTHKTLNNWYFANLDDGGWHLTGSRD